MGALKPWHIAVFVVVLVLLFGAKRLPDAARSLGRSLRIIKAETKGLVDDDNTVAEKAEPQFSHQPLPPNGAQQGYQPGYQQQGYQQQPGQPYQQPGQPFQQQPQQPPAQPYVDPVQRTNDR
ncbi:Sec-independent protein translocase subunit TatA [Couchioplanes caeruleus]|uniref:Sec-independent protein translocase subunit TatA n=1 Tax=Couchioplanes caeruleus TaxID=56438 RepID=UPI00201C16FA|nr:Sec-independent protein translocase subunit TatA [Couchioplanes caeruleus]UQU68131.1 Sec-independent protein translocase subunit TatA [Couchioplanes caeruleus]